MCAGRLEELQGAQEVPAAAGLCPHHPAQMEAFLSVQIFGGRDGSGGVEGVQGEVPLSSDVWERDAAPGPGKGSHGSPQVRGREV